MGVVNFDEYLRSAIQAGQAVEGTAARVLADNGDEIGEGVYKVIQGGNGTASGVWVAVQSAVGGLISTGMAYMTMEVGLCGVAIAPALGLAGGYGLYNLSPDTWNNIAMQLVDAGQTIGHKVLVYWNGTNAYFSEETLNIFKNAFIEAGLFDGGEGTTGEQPGVETLCPPFNYSGCPLSPGNYVLTNVAGRYGGIVSATGNLYAYRGYINDYNYYTVYVVSDEPFTYAVDITSTINTSLAFTNDGITAYYGEIQFSTDVNPSYVFLPEIPPGILYSPPTCAWDIIATGVLEENPYLEPGATYPSGEDNVTTTYPSWSPYTYPQELPDPQDLPIVLPIEYPLDNSNPNQATAQDPEPENVPEIYPVIIPNFPLPQPNPNPEPEPEPDPDPEPEPDPLPEDEPIEPQPDPANPNPDPDPSLPIVVPNLPTTVSSNKLFTVYNPSSSQLDALGGYLWDSSIIAAIRDIWQEPMDGLISLQQVFVTPSTSGSHNIILGFLDSGVSAPVVSDQFVTVDCGSVTVEEKKENATDYAPYTSLHCYLPFIGIVELDTNECMDSTISIKYQVDVYTGTCLAQISIDRDADMPNDPILYTFSGNCAQQLPLTSGNATGLFTALIGAVTAGISAASGGGLSTLAGAQLLGNSLTHEMMHVNHSGNISANAGIMGLKKPYLIIGRRHCYDANDYNKFYGYPANKTLVLGNHEGFVRVKECWIKTKALQEEYEEIMKLLDEGVFV